MFTMLVVLNPDFQETMELPCDNQIIDYADGYCAGNMDTGYLIHRKMDCK